MKKQIFYSILSILLAIGLMAAILTFAASRKHDQQIQKPQVQKIYSDEKPPKEQPQESGPYTGKIAYAQMTAEAKRVYEAIDEVVTNRKTGANLPTTDEDILHKAWQAYQSDHGGMFWISGYKWNEHWKNDELVSLSFYPNYVFSEEDQQLYQGYINEKMESYLANISADASDYEKAKYIYEMLIYNVTYNLAAKENQNILSVFLWDESVCSGFASAAQYLLEKLRIPCMIVYGQSMGENHAWNLAQLDGEYYYLDTTWGNTASQNLNTCSYEYLGLNDRQIAGTHTIDMYFAPPACEGTEDNYYVHEGLYFENYDREKIGALLENAWENEQKTAAFRFATADLMAEAHADLIDQYSIGDYCDGMETIQYVENDDLHVLTFVLQE